MSGDPGEQYYVDPPSREALGRRWVVFRGTVPGIYNTWYVVFLHYQPLTDTRLRPGAEAQILGVSGANHKAFGTPQEAWRQYELQRRNNFVQRLPYVPPGAPPFPPIPQTPRRGNNQPATNRTPVTPSRPAPVTPAAARATSSDSSSQQGDPFTPPPRSSKGKASMYGKKVQTPTSLHEQPAAGPSNCSPSPLRFTRNPRDVVPPWEANSHVFVVFEGAPPGLYSSWCVLSLLT